MDRTVKAFLIDSLAFKSFFSIASSEKAACHGKLKLRAAAVGILPLQVMAKVVLANPITLPLC